MIEVNQVYYLRSSDQAISELGECGGSLTALMKFLLEKGIVDGVLTVRRGYDIYDVVPVLVTDPNKLGETAGSLHCGTSNIAQILVKYLSEFPQMMLALTVKPCEANTISEVANRDRLDLSHIIMVGVNCGGTFPPIRTRNLIREILQVDVEQVINEEIDQGQLIIEMTDGSRQELSIDELENRGYGRRANCRRCELNIPTSADIGFGNWGVMGDYKGKYSCAEVFTERGAQILNQALNAGMISLEEPSSLAGEMREKIDQSMVKLARKWQDQDFDDEDDILNTFAHYQGEFEKCIKCFGCRNVCPICYCQECTLETSSPEWVDKGQIPPSPLFHLERLIHMVESCTNCGQCQEVCPADIPLAKIWHQIHLKTRKLDYSPGRETDHLLFDTYKRPE